MKKNVLLLTVLFAVLAVFTSCALFGSGDAWQDAKYKEDTEIGEGSTAFSLEVKVGEHSVTLTVHTDEKILGDALINVGIISGDDGPYGLYIKTVNGITADYDTDGHYWSFSIGGEYSMVGIDSVEVKDGEHYELTYSK